MGFFNFNKTEPERWRRAGKREKSGSGALSLAERFLKEREAFYVGACSHFLKWKNQDCHLWYLPETGKNQGETTPALLFHSRRTLFPLFDGNTSVPAPHFLRRFLKKIPLHTAQGLKRNVETLETMLAALDLRPQETIDYDLLTMDAPPPEKPDSAPPGLILRQARLDDADSLFPLQAAYEQEEVLPKSATFNPAVCRINLENIIKNERTLIAELDHQIVGKINTNAWSFSRCQIGGVYVLPACRGLGIARSMTAAFVRNLIAEGRGISLFVKKSNPPAQAVYRSAGFIPLGNYRICYY